MSFEPKDRLVQLSRQMRLFSPLLFDPQKYAYRAYGRTAGSLRRGWAWGTVWAYLRLMARGNRYRFGPGDTRQMGRDLIVDREGTMVYEFRGALPHQRPAIDDLIMVLGVLRESA